MSTIIEDLEQVEIGKYYKTDIKEQYKNLYPKEISTYFISDRILLYKIPVKEALENTINKSISEKNYVDYNNLNNK